MLLLSTCCLSFWRRARNLPISVLGWSNPVVENDHIDSHSWSLSTSLAWTIYTFDFLLWNQQIWEWNLPRCWPNPHFRWSLIPFSCMEKLQFPTIICIIFAMENHGNPAFFQAPHGSPPGSMLAFKIAASNLALRRGRCWAPSNCREAAAKAALRWKRLAWSLGRCVALVGGLVCGIFRYL